MLIERDNKAVPAVRQCELLSLSRSSLYYRPHRDPTAAAFEQWLLNAIDWLYTQRPNLGRGGMTDALAEQFKVQVNPKREHVK